MKNLKQIIFVLTYLIGGSFAIAAEPPSEPILRIDLDEHTEDIQHIATDRAGRWLATVSNDATVRLWNLKNGKLLSTLRPPIGKIDMPLLAVAISPDGNLIATAGFSGYEWDKLFSIYIFDRANGSMLRRIPGLPGPVRNLSFSHDGLALAAGMTDNLGLRIFSVKDGQQFGEDRNYGGYVYGIHVSNNGQFLTTSDDGYIRLYRIHGQQLSLIMKRASPCRTEIVSVTPEGSRIAIACNVGKNSIYVLDGYSLDEIFVKENVVGGNLGLGKIDSLTWSMDGETLYAAMDDFATKSEIYIIRGWADKGAGLPVDWPIPKSLSNNVLPKISQLMPLPNGRLAFSMLAPSWGVFDAAGKIVYFHKSIAPDFTFSKNKTEFKISREGNRVRFNNIAGDSSPVIFDVVASSLLSEDAEGLVPPNLNSTGLLITDWELTIGGPKSKVTAPAGTEPKLNGKYFRKKDELRDLVLGVANFHDSRGFVLATQYGLTAYSSLGNKLWKSAIFKPAWGVNVSADGQWVVAAYGDGTIRWHRATDGVEQIALFMHTDKKRWIMWTPEGYYNASPGGENLIGWHLNQGKDKEARFIPSGQLYDVFFRPDIVQAKFRGDDISSLITLTATQALKYPPPILSFTKVPSTTKNNMEKVCYKAVATGGGIGEVRLFQNGKLIKSDGFYRETVAKVDSSIKLAAMDSATITRALKRTKTEQKSEPPMVANSKGNEFEECQEIETIPGDNEISVAAFNANNTVQSKLESINFTADRKTEAPHLYVLGIGIDKYTAAENNLSYAVKDATDFRTMIQDKAKGLYNAQNIHFSGLSDAQATKAGIQKTIQAISAKAKPWDSFILFVASHGYLQDNQYYIVTAEFDGTINTSKMISSNEIVGMSKNIKSLSQLLIFDTCHAGGVDNIIGGLYDARMSVMAKKMGLHIYASAGGTQTALDGYKGNGLFTHALLKSMQAGNMTDSNQDKEVSVVELGEHAKQETINISKTLGFPQSPNIINFGKDNALFRVQ